MLNSIRNSLNKAQLRHLVWAGFALVLAILLLSNVTNISQLSTVQTTVDYVVDDVQPTLLRSQHLEYSIERAISAQNSYLLSQDVRHKESYAEASSEILAILEELKVSEIINQSERSRELLATVEKSVGILKQVMIPDGFNVGLNLGKVAGAGVEEHLHFHIVPRWFGDTNALTVFADVRVIPEHLKTTYDNLKPQFDILNLNTKN